MSPSTSSTKLSTHSRSISLPTRSHPSTANVEEHLCRLRTPESAKFSKLADLKDLFECLDNFLRLPTTKQDLSNCGEVALGESLGLLDLCSTTKDAFSQIRASVQDLELCLRRRETDVSSKVESYLICKKKANKMVSKCYANVKRTTNNNKNDNSSVVSMLREVEKVSITILESIFSSLCHVKKTSKQNLWSLAFKSTQSKHVNCEEVINQVQNMDLALEAMNKKSSNDNNISSMQEVQKCLMALNMNLQECDEELDCLTRSLIRTRVTILNLLY